MEFEIANNTATSITVAGPKSFTFWDLMSIVVVDHAEWLKAKGGDKDAIESLKTKLNDVCIYDHCLNMGPGDWIAVTVREVIDAGIVEAVTLHTRFFNGSKS